MVFLSPVMVKSKSVESLTVIVVSSMNRFVWGIVGFVVSGVPLLLLPQAVKVSASSANISVFMSVVLQFVVRRKIIPQVLQC